MSDDDLKACLALFGTYRGERVRQLEVDEFARLYARSERGDVEAAIRAAAERDGRVFLETIARRFAEVRDMRLKSAHVAQESEKFAALPAVDYARPGWPCAVGSPVGSYLRWIAVGAVQTRAKAEAVAARYVRQGLVTQELADRVIAAPPPLGSLPPLERSAALGREIEQIESEIGSWARVEASQYVAACQREAQAA